MIACGVVLNRYLFLRHCSSFLAAGPITVLASEERSKRTHRLHMSPQPNTWGTPIKNYDHLFKILESLHQIGYQDFKTDYRGLNSQASKAAWCRKAFESRHIQFATPHTSVKLWDPNSFGTEVEEIPRIARYSAEDGILSSDRQRLQAATSQGKAELSQVHAVIEGLNRVGRACQREGLKFCHHNHIQEFPDEPSEMSFIVSETDPKLVWLNDDVGNAYPGRPKPGTFSVNPQALLHLPHHKSVNQDPNGKVIPADLVTGKIDLTAVVAPWLKQAIGRAGS